MRAATLMLAVAGLVTAVLAVAQTRAPEAGATEPAPEAVLDPGAALPNEPTKVLVLARCNMCHGLAWIERSGANEEGWTDRIERMNRAGAMIPPDEIPVLAAYLARALPERLRPPPPKRRGSARP